MGLDRDQFQDLIIDPVLEGMGMYSTAASELVLGTCLHESHLRYLVQLDGDADPYDDAMGLPQIERKTIIDNWTNYLRYRADLTETIRRICLLDKMPATPETVIWNLRYAIVHCRLKYRRVKAPLPPAGDIEAQARYYCQWYNTSLGKATVEQYVENWRRGLTS